MQIGGGGVFSVSGISSWFVLVFNKCTVHVLGLGSLDVCHLCLASWLVLSIAPGEITSMLLKDS